jgi:mycofactocin glycosyltransferase
VSIGLPARTKALIANATYYCLRKGVTLQARAQQLFLVCAYPLQAVQLKGCWQAFFRQMEDGRPRSVPQLRHAPPDVAPLELKRFLDRLAGKGFLVAAQTSTDTPLPTVSVIIPVRNRPQALNACLGSLAAVHYPREKLEIIVVDDGSVDATAQIARRYPVKLLRNPQTCGASFSRNRGAAAAGGDILCFLDSDCQVAPQWLLELTLLFEDPQVAAGGGLVDSQRDRNALDRYEQVRSSLHMGHRPRDSRDGDRFFYLPSCNLAVRRTQFAPSGGFNTQLAVGEDVDLCWRLIDSGGAIVYRPQAVVYHDHRNRLIDFCRRRSDYGTSEPLLQSMHPRRRKTLPLWPQAILFWLLFAAAVLVHPLLGLAAPALLMADVRQSRRTANRLGVRLSCASLSAAKMRHYLAALYHLAAFSSRYYLLPAMLLAFVLPWIGAIVAAGHVAVGLVQYAIKKPRLDPGRFLFWFTLEQISYQSGVWSACLRHNFFAPVIPRPTLHRAHNV